MSRTELRSLLAIAAVAFALRAGVAILTEYKTIFPAYYYTDAVFVDQYAREATRAWSLGSPAYFSYSPPQRLHILLTALVYRAAGPYPIAAKLINVLATTIGLAAFGLLAGRVFGPRIGLVSAALIGLWPSHVFYTSQNFKEGLVCGILMSSFLLLTPRTEAPRGWARLEVAAGLASMAILGFFRSHVMLLAAASLAAAAVAALLRRRGSRRAAFLVLAACLAAPVVYKFSLSALLKGPLRASVSGETTESIMIPKISDSGSGEIYKPLSPRGITEFRRLRQYSDRLYAKGQFGREIGTQLFPGERMDSWLDVALFIPRASFHVLFMPLPGLYPMDGKPGRFLSAAENLALLAIAALGLAAALRGGLEPRRLGLLLFFGAMTAGSSLLEFDLGSAGRHKLMFMPMLFPFAAEEALRLIGRRRTP